MIELIESPVASLNDGDWYFRKSFVILISKVSDTTYKAITLKSKKLYPYPASSKRWRLLEKFKKEGCLLSRINVKRWLDSGRSYERRKLFLSLEEAIELGQITDEDIINDLKKVDNYRND